MRPALLLLCWLGVFCSGEVQDQGGSCATVDADGVVGSSVLQRSPLNELSKVASALEESEDEEKAGPEPEPEGEPEGEPEPEAEPEPEGDRSKRAEDARFLMQSTFGPTTELLEELKAVPYAQWIQKQMQLPVETHREYFRKRVNPPWDSRVEEKVMRAAPCQRGRFRSFAFSFKDVGQSVTVNGSVISVGGKPRTGIKPHPLASTWLGMVGFEGTVCHVTEELGADVAVAKTGGDCRRRKQTLPNPSVWSVTQDSPAELTGQVREVKAGVVVLAAAQGACNLTAPGDGSHLFVRVGGEHYVYDERLQLQGNTPDQPSREAGFCTPRNHLNERSCQLPELAGGTVASGLMAEIHATGGSKYLSQLSESTFLAYHLDETIDGFAGFPHLPWAFAIRWTGSLQIQLPGTYVFYLTSDDGSQLLINGTRIVDNGGNHGMRERSGEVTLAAGSHPIEVEYFQSGHGLGIAFRWKGPDSQDVKEVVPSSALSTNAKTFKASSCIVSCGSPGEVASEPALGHHMPLRTSGDRRGLHDDEFDNRYTDRMHSSLAKSTVWTMKVLQGEDQLRQRMAWALSQIIVVSTQGIGDDQLTEMWITFYDTFVRNAFGNFRDILKEVTFNPLMGRYLTHTGSSSYDYNGNMPNENYGREIMQLFTIGLNMLNEDGTEQKDAAGASIPTYTNENILNFARVLTGFLSQGDRDNVEWNGRTNYIDPMRIDPARHDIFPKPDLTGGYIGDGYPSCGDKPAQGAFLKKGSRYEFSGLNHPETAGLVLQAGSKLGEALCGPALRCSKVVVVLEADVVCLGDECTAASVDLVKVGSHWYKHVPPACVHNFFPEPTALEADGPGTAAQPGWCVDANGKHWGGLKLDSLDGEGADRQAECVAKCRKANATGCQLIWSQWNKGCYAMYWTMNFTGNGKGRHYCWNLEKKGLKGRSYMLAKKGLLSCPVGSEVEDLKECEQAAVSLGLPLTHRPHINTRHWHRVPHGCSYGNGRIYYSINGTEYRPTGNLPPLCRAFTTIGGDGTLVMSNGHTSFTVPDLDPVPSPGMHVVTAETSLLFSTLPASKADALAKLKMAAPTPTSACSVCQGEVKAYGSTGQDLNADTVLEVDGKFFKNVESRAKLEAGGSFRNPPVFLKSVKDPFAQKQVLAEVEALLDHLFTHQNTPVFIGRRLIQRFVSSNPSPAYVAAVSRAFKTGAYDGVTYSGKYGDLGATVAAVLLHPEARVLATNQRTSARGALREPMVKFIHLMRSMRYQDEAKEPIVFHQLQDVIGQFPYQSPSVFNYYLADYDLPMVSSEPEPEPEAEEPEPEPEAEEPEPEPEPEPENLFGPEFQIFTPPYLVGYLNGMQAMIQSGVDSRCTSGKDLGISITDVDDGVWRQVCPQGSLKWQGAGSSNKTVEELDILLTGGRLTPVAKAVVKHAYEKAGEGHKIGAAQKALVMTAEFNTLGAPLPLPGTRPPPAHEDGGAKATYKAVVFLFLAGGADTWNMLVPQGCDLYEEYRIIRTDLTMEPRELSSVQTTGQACSEFGVHASFDFVKKLYDKDQAAFVTNVGNLVEPMTMETFRSGAAQKCFNLFSHSDQQNGAMTLKCQQMGTMAHGTGGRIADALAAGDQGMRTESFSLAGSSVWSKGAVTRREIVDNHGSKTFKGYEEWLPSIQNLTSQRHGNVYAEAYSDAFLRGLETSQSLGRTLQEAKTVTNYNTNGGLRRQLFQVAKLISAREGRKAERDFFFVSVGGWDMHSNLKMGLQNGFGVVDDALQGFVQELEAQKVWENVVVMTSSEFARTLDSNGGGSDHAWAGQQIIMSGSLKGGKVFNKFPASMLPGSDRDLGRGRLIPEYPWESVLVPVADWLGVTPNQYAVTFPNLANFNTSHIIPTSQLLK